MDLKSILKSKQVLITAAACVIILLLAILLLHSNSGKKVPSLEDQLALGQKYLEEMDYDDAILAFEAAIEIDPKCEEAYVGLASAYVGLGNYEKAVTVLEDGLKQVEDVIPLHEKLLEVYLETEDYENCIKELKTLISLDSQKKEYYEKLIEIYKEQGMTEELIEFLNEIKDSEAMQPEIYTILAEVYQEEEMPDEIIELLEPLQEEEFFDKDLSKILAKAYQEKGMEDEAIAVLENSVDDGDADGEIYYMLAQLYKDKEELDKAEQAVLQSLLKYNSEEDSDARNDGINEAQKLLEEIQKGNGDTTNDPNNVTGSTGTGEQYQFAQNSSQENQIRGQNGSQINGTGSSGGNSGTVGRVNNGKPEEPRGEVVGSGNTGSNTKPETRPIQPSIVPSAPATEPVEPTKPIEPEPANPTEPVEPTNPTESEEPGNICIVNGSYRISTSSNPTGVGEEELIDLWKRQIGTEIAEQLLRQSDEGIALYQDGTTIYVAFFGTESDGEVHPYSFELKNISSVVDMVFTAPGCTNVKYSGLDLTERESVQMQEVKLLYDDSSLMDVQVLEQAKLRFISAVDNSPIEGLNIALMDGWNNKTDDYVAQAVTGEDGYAEFQNISSGYYTVKYSGEGYITGYENCYIPDEISISVSPKLEANQYRVVLRWGETPSDLDLHCVGKVGDESFEVYFGNMEYASNDGSRVELDVDDTSSYGPETITFTISQDSSFAFFVHNFSSNSDTELSLSGATVTLYQGDSSVPAKEYRVPTDKTGYYWNIFRIDNGVVNEINEVSDTPISVD